MHTSPSIRKVFEGVATRHEMHRLFNRHRGDPAMAEGDAPHLFVGEWFEIAECDHDYMLEILPPLWMRADMFAMREFMTTLDDRRLHPLRRPPVRQVAIAVEPAPPAIDGEREEDAGDAASERWPTTMHKRTRKCPQCVKMRGIQGLKIWSAMPR